MKKIGVLLIVLFVSLITTSVAHAGGTCPPRICDPKDPMEEVAWWRHRVYGLGVCAFEPNVRLQGRIRISCLEETYVMVTGPVWMDLRVISAGKADIRSNWAMVQLIKGKNEIQVSSSYLYVDMPGVQSPPAKITLWKSIDMSVGP